MIRSFALALCVFCTSAALFPIGALAEEEGDNAVVDRVFKDLEPIGIRAGKFLLFPSLQTSATYTTNVLKTDGNEESDKLYTVSPELKGEYTYRDHFLGFKFYADRMEYQDTRVLNRTNYDVDIANVLQISNTAALHSNVNVSRHHQTRLDNSAETSVFEPIAVDQKGVQSRFVIKPGVTEYEVGLDYQDYSYEDTTNIQTGNRLVQSDRDRQSYSLGLRATYKKDTLRDDRRFIPYLGLQITKIDYEKNDYIAGAGFTGVNQDKTRYMATGGFEIKPDGKWLGNVQLGYGMEAPDDNSLDNQTLGLVDIDLTYLYTPTTNFMFNIRRTFSDDTSSTQGTIDTRLSAALIQELSRQWVVSAGVRYDTHEFANDLMDSTWSGTIGVNYKMNRNFTLGGDIEFLDRESDRNGGDFTDTRAMIRLKSQF